MPRIFLYLVTIVFFCLFFFAARLLLAQDFFSCSKKKILVATKKIIEARKKCFVNISRKFFLASEIISFVRSSVASAQVIYLSG